MTANADERALAVVEVFKEKLIKRGISRSRSSRSASRAPPARRSRSTSTSRRASRQEQAKKVGKLIRDEGPKGVKVQVQGDELRVTSKKRDDLQAVIALVKEQDYDFAVQFTNYR